MPGGREVLVGRTAIAVPHDAAEVKADYHRQLLREGLAKGYSGRATEMSKKMFKKSISTLKGHELKDLCRALGLIK
jgi:hypothetical protein